MKYPIELFVEGFQNGAFIIGTICGTLFFGLAILGVVIVIWAVRDALTKRKKYRKWG